MTPSTRRSITSAAELREAFDATFALATRTGPPPQASLLAVRVAGQRFAVRIEEVAGLHADLRVAPLPTPMPDLLGMASLRGKLAAVYDLAAVLGYAPTAGVPRWLVMVRARNAVALAFDGFEGQLVVSNEQIVAAGPASTHASSRHVREAVRAADKTFPIIHVASIMEAIQARAAAIPQPKEN